MRVGVALAVSFLFVSVATAARAEHAPPLPASLDSHDEDARDVAQPGESASAATVTPPLAEDGAKTSPPLRAHLHVVSRTRVVVQRREEGGAWSDVCSSPCDVDLPVGDGIVYRVVGDRIVQAIALRPAYVEVVVDPPSNTGKAFGGIGIGAGGITALVGLTMIGRGNRHAGYDCNRPGPDYPDTYGECVADHDGADELVRNGVIALVAGAVVAGLGAWLFVASSRGSVTTVAPRDGASGATRRTPSWRSGISSAEGALRAPAPIFPLLLDGRF